MKLCIDLFDIPDCQLDVIPFDDEPQNISEPKFHLRSSSLKKDILTIQLTRDNQFEILNQEPVVSEQNESIRAKLEGLAYLLVNEWREGNNPFENDDDEVVGNSIQPYDAQKIRIETKTFSLRQIKDMIDDGDLDISPDFQRNFVWEPKRQSQLIESVLLRIPLPVFYFSQDQDGVLHVVDGVQRLTSIHRFMTGKSKLSKLEYLTEYEGYSFPLKDMPSDSRQSQKVLDETAVRRINQTKISVNIIDPQSPSKVKYDVFRRINTGGRPLNAQEIRNCLASQALRDTLKKMGESTEFLEATGNKVQVSRMQPEELALRFIAFRRIMESKDGLESYSNKMEPTLNDTVESLSVSRDSDLEVYVKDFKRAMRNASYLFGNSAFRKIRRPAESRRSTNILNKALFLSWSLVLADMDTDTIRNRLERNALVEPLERRISEDAKYSSSISNGTNDKAQIKKAYETAKEIINSVLNSQNHADSTD